MKDPLIKIKSFKFIKFFFHRLRSSELSSLSARDFPSYKFSETETKQSQVIEYRKNACQNFHNKLSYSITHFHTFTFSIWTAQRVDDDEWRRGTYDGKAFPSPLSQSSEEGLSNFFPNAVKRKTRIPLENFSEEFYQFLKTCRKGICRYHSAATPTRSINDGE